ncbi:MAG: phage tail tape measure protein [Beijerinckiaceae bacterium]
MASRTSQLIAELVDRVSGPAAGIRKSLSSIGDASKRVGAQVEASGRAHQRAAALAAKNAAAVKPSATSIAAIGARGLAAVGGGYAVARMVASSITSYADLDRQMRRVGNTADATAAQVASATEQAKGLAQEVAMPMADVVKGLEALVASGRSLPEAMSFLPSVARTAQASGAQVDEIAKTAAAMGQHLKIGADEMQNAFDILVAGGNAGEFELKDMARYLPSLAPAAKALGLEGQKGLTSLVSMLQIIRKGSGTSEEAAASMNNILQKMSSEETVKRFKKMGVDLEAAFKKGKAEGRNLLEVFEDAAWTAVKGDLSQLPKLISDMEFARGVRAILSMRGAWQDMAKTITTTAPGQTMKQLTPIVQDARAKIDRLTGAWENFKTSFGAAIAPGVVPALEAVQRALDRLREPPQRSGEGEREDAEDEAYEAEKARTHGPGAGGVSGPGALSSLFNPENFGYGKLGERDADLAAARWKGVSRAIAERIQKENETLAAPARIREMIARQEQLMSASDARAGSSSGMAAVRAREQVAKSRAEILRLKAELAAAEEKAREVEAKRAAAPGEIARLRAQQLHGGFGVNGWNGAAPGTVGPGSLMFGTVPAIPLVERNAFDEARRVLEELLTSAGETRASIEGIGSPVSVSVDTASLERTVTLAREANAELRALAANGDAARRASEGAAQSVRTAMRAAYNDYGLKESG